MRLLGWLLLIGGALAIAGFVGWSLLVSPDKPVFFTVAFLAIYGGLALLLLSVLRQRLIERKTDKYKDVKL